MGGGGATRGPAEAKLVFFPAYAFSHRSEEAWRAGRLMSLNSETVEQGERLRVEGAGDASTRWISGLTSISPVADEYETAWVPIL
jgi:hypothetical protein